MKQVSCTMPLVVSVFLVLCTSLGAVHSPSAAETVARLSEFPYLTLLNTTDSLEPGDA